MPARSSESIRIALVQMAATSEPSENIDRALAAVERAAKNGARIVCLPELFASQYFAQREDHELFDLAEPIPGPTVERFSKIAKRAGAAVIVPLFERRAAGVYHNSAALIEEDGSLAGTYRKMHIPDDPLYYEKFYFAPGDLGFRSFRLSAASVGVLICWDQWYPEAARITALTGADLLFYPTAIGWHPGEKKEWGESQLDAWRTIQRSHAIANGLFVAAVNRVGHEHGDVKGDRVEGPGIEFWGSSFIADPSGVVLAQGSTDHEEIVSAEIDLAEVERVRRHWPFLRDRRIDAYGAILNRFADGS